MQDMDITPLGHASYKIRGKAATVIVDPYDSAMVGLKFPKKVEADIVTVSHDHDDHNKASEVEGSPYIVRGPGEYEIKGVHIVGFPSFHDTQKGAERGRNTMFRIEVDGVAILHLGDLGHPLTSEEIEKLDGVDILFVPVGGGGPTIDAVQAAAIVKELEPSIVIPMHYLRSGMTKTFAALAPVSAFLKEIGIETAPPTPKLTISKDKLPEQMQVLVLE
jgi:L-ascorbate metabolism protein UlaG (beta-lactamase superfamily)